MAILPKILLWEIFALAPGRKNEKMKKITKRQNATTNKRTNRKNEKKKRENEKNEKTRKRKNDKTTWHIFLFLSFFLFSRVLVFSFSRFLVFSFFRFFVFSFFRFFAREPIQKPPKAEFEVGLTNRYMSCHKFKSILGHTIGIPMCYFGAILGHIASACASMRYLGILFGHTACVHIYIFIILKFRKQI